MSTFPEPAKGGPVTTADAGAALVYGTIFASLAKAAISPLQNFDAATNILILAGPIYVALKKKNQLEKVFWLKPVWDSQFMILALLSMGVSSAELFIYEGVDWISKGRFSQWVHLFPSANVPDSLIQALFIVAILVPVTEELLFRGFLTTAFSEWNKGWAVFLPAIIFTLLHHPAGMAGALVTSVLCTVSVLHFGSLVPAVFIHAAGNGFLVLLTRFGDTFRSPWYQALYIVMRLGPVIGLFLMRCKVAWFWSQARLHWLEFTEKPQFGLRFKSLFRHWSWIVVLLIFAAPVFITIIASIFGL